MSNNIQFFAADVSYQPAQKTLLRKWLSNIIKKESRKANQINFIFCSDNYLLEINRQYLQHDYYTDIITFDLSEGKEIVADIYISIDRVKDNAKSNSTTIKNEMHRIMVHGILHLLGYKDKSPADKKKMTAAEDTCLKQLDGILASA
jgi:probable rRNA maturation factor